MSGMNCITDLCTSVVSLRIIKKRTLSRKKQTLDGKKQTLDGRKWTLSKKAIGESSMYTNKIRFFRRLALVVFVVCLFMTVRTYFQSVQHREQQNDLKAMTETKQTGDFAENNGAPDETGGAPRQADGAADQTENQETQDSISASDLSVGQTDGGNTPNLLWQETTVAAEPVMLDKFARLYAENNDLVGWLSIEGMKIDYPVMQNEDDEYYLHRDYYGKDSKYGCLYVREQADLDDGTNFVIYGHNMKDGSMFGDLDLYLDESFYKEHPVISFDTLYEERAYEIVAVFRSQVYSEDDDVFKYYHFYEADTREEFADFYDNIKALSLYDTGVDAEFGDTFLTLSTCAYHVKDGRFVVVAKRVE